MARPTGESPSVRQHHRTSSVSDLKEQFDYYLARRRCGDSDNAVMSLIELGSSVLPLLERAFSTEVDPQVREDLVHVAWQTRVPAALTMLTSAMDDPEPRVWKEAIDGLVTLGTTEAADTLRHAKVRNPNRRTCGHHSFSEWIDDALAQIGGDPR